MTKTFRSVLIFFLSIIFFGCSFDNKTGIWTDKPKQKATNNALIKLSDDQDKFQKELNPELTINFNSHAKINKEWKSVVIKNLNIVGKEEVVIELC